MFRDHKSKNALRPDIMAVDEYDSFKPYGLGGQASPNAVDAGYPLRRFWLRSLVGVCAPLLIAGYYLAVWRLYLAPIDPAPGFIVAPPAANYVYYGWFIVGVVGLNLSLYGTAGAEAGMLMDPSWDVGDAMMLIMHADGTWSGPGGWLKTVKRLWRLRGAGRGNRWPSALWFALALPSMLIFLAWPLSGLSFEMTAGYIRRLDSTGTGPNITGFTYATFNERVGLGGAGNTVTWENALDARIPGKGIVYTQPGAARITDPYLPKNDGVGKIFLTAQAQNPIDGTSWGLALRYNCSVVQTMDDFKILKYAGKGKPSNKTSVLAVLQSQDPTIDVKQLNESYVENFYGVIEYATSRWPNSSAMAQLYQDLLSMQTQTDCYYNKLENITGDYPGLDDEEVLELVLWQNLVPVGYVYPLPNYNMTIDSNLTELYGVYDYTQFGNATVAASPMTAIGVRCSSSASVGTAEVDGVRSTYTNFVRTDTPINPQSQRCAPRLTPARVLPVNGVSVDGPVSTGWIGSLFSSVGAPPVLTGGGYIDPDDPIDQVMVYRVQLALFQAQDLRSSMLRAYAAYAVQLMYNGGQGLTSSDGSHTLSANPNVTEFLPGAVLTRGIVPPYVPAALFLAWGFAVAVLCLVYGFRRRWSATLDGYSLFRFGADLSEAAKSRIGAFTNTREVEECGALDGLPGFVGDKRPGAWTGHIALVDGVTALKSKHYD